MKKLIFVLISFIQVGTLVADDSWTPPIGIPVPPFGINETYRMYDDPGARNPDLVYQSSESGGYFTHYIDISNSNATDSGNPFGSIAKPRKSVPSSSNGSVPAGSVVEIHGGPYEVGNGYPKYWTWWSGEGTAQYPIFIRGVDNPVHRGLTCIRLAGQYIIIEGIDFENSGFSTSYAKYYGPGHMNHLVMRNCEVHGYLDDNISPITCVSCEDMVIYNNHIHNNGIVPYRQDTDVCGIVVYTDTLRCWILDNHIHDNDGDAIIINGSGGSYDPSHQPEYIYIGRNILHGDKENAVDLKDSDHIIISQNEIYGYGMEPRVFGADPQVRVPSGSDGTALVLGNEGNTRNWTLFNNIHDCHVAMRTSDDYLMTKTYLIGNLVHDIDLFAFMTWRRAEVNLILNTFYNIGCGFFSESGSNNVEGLSKYYFYNNVIASISGCTYGTRSYDQYLYVGNGLAAKQSTVENCLFYDGNGFVWNRYKTYDSLSMFAANESDNVQNCIEADPMFVDPENGDFTLQEASPVNDMPTSPQIQLIFDRFYELYGIELSDDIAGVPRTTEVNDDSTSTSSTDSTPSRTQPETQTNTSNNEDSNTSSTSTDVGSRKIAQQEQAGESDTSDTDDTSDSNDSEKRIISGRSAYIRTIFERFEDLYNNGSSRVGTNKEYFE